MLKWGRVLSLHGTSLCLQSCERKATSQSLYRVTDEMWLLQLPHKNTAKNYFPQTFAKFKDTCLWFRGKCNHACWLCGNITWRVSCDSFILKFFFISLFSFHPSWKKQTRCCGGGVLVIHWNRKRDKQIFV